MPAPAWMVETSLEDKSSTQLKINKASAGSKDKKQKGSRHIRSRARLPTGAESSNYELPEWIEDDKFKNMMVTILKSLSNTQQRLRILESVAAENFVVPSAINPVTAAVTMAEAYHRKAVKGGEDLGAPGPQVLYAFCEELVKLNIGEQPQKDVKQFILNKLESLTATKASQVAAVFTVKPCFDPQYHKVILVSSDLHVRSTMVKSLTALSDVRHFTAPAPASGQEDEIQKWIEKLESFGN